MQRHYNKIHSQSRIVVEHTFGLLKSRWRILKFINVNKIEKAVKIITACCILHNICYVNLDFWDDYEPLQVDMDENIYNGNDDVDSINKRDTIANAL